MSFSFPIFPKYPKGYTSAYLAVFLGNFTFYGLRGILMIYFTSVLSLGDGESLIVYSTFMALAYLTPLVGGVLADNVIGVRQSIFLGGILIFIGCFILFTAESDFFRAGLALITLGTGFFKPSSVASVGLLFKNQDDPVKDQAYTTFYSGMNFGTFATSIISGWLGQTFGWKYVFPVVAFAILAGVVSFKLYTKKLYTQKEIIKNAYINVYSIGAGLILSSIFIVALLSLNSNMWLLPTIIISAVCCLIYVFMKSQAHERPGLIRLSKLMVLFTFFCALFEQTGSSITLFIEREVDRAFCPYFSIPTPFFQSLIPGFILVFMPLLNKMWEVIDSGKRPVSIYSKFAWGFLGVSLSFWILVIALKITPIEKMINSGWVVANYAFHVLGDLCIVPLGFAAVSKDSPKRFATMMMGVWMVCIACGHYFAGILAKGAVIPNQITTVVQGRLIYLDFFTQVALAPLIVALFIFGVRILYPYFRQQK